VSFIGVAVLEDDVEAVATFVEEMGEKMDYRVALDLVPKDGEKEDGKTVKNWMEPAELRGIPGAFIINGDSKIAWIGHPFEMDDPLGKIVDGTWDLDAEAKKIAETKALQKKMQETMMQLQKLYAKFADDGNADELLAAVDAAEKEIPEQAQTFKMIKFQILTIAKDHVSDALAMVDAFLKSEQAQEASFLNHVAWVIVNPDRDSRSQTAESRAESCDESRRYGRKQRSFHWRYPGQSLFR